MEGQLWFTWAVTSGLSGTMCQCFLVSKSSYLFLWGFGGSLLFVVDFVFLFCFLTKHLQKEYAFQKGIV